MKNNCIKYVTLIAAIIGLGLLSGCATTNDDGDLGRFTTDPVYVGLSRLVEDNVLFSDQDPSASFAIDQGFDYIGGQKFILYGLADTEQYIFVEATDTGELKSFYWIQFEAYLPDNSYSYNYESLPLQANFDGLEFTGNTAIVKLDPNRTPRNGSDSALIRQLLSREGFEYPAEFAYARIVHIPDEAHRKELLIIFIEKLSELGYKAEELFEGGSKFGIREEVEQSHLDRLKRTLRITTRVSL